MASNWISGDVGAGVTLSVPVDAKAVRGDVTSVGSPADGGLLAYCVTARGEGVGNDATHASGRLLPTEAVVELAVDGSPVAGNPVYTKVDTNSVIYKNASGTSGSYHIGHVVDIPGRTPNAGTVFVYLGSATAVKGA